MFHDNDRPRIGRQRVVGQRNRRDIRVVARQGDRGVERAAGRVDRDAVAHEQSAVEDLGVRRRVDGQVVLLPPPEPVMSPTGTAKSYNDTVSKSIICGKCYPCAPVRANAAVSARIPLREGDG